MNNDFNGSVVEFQGSRVAQIPELPGLYAWYYRPLATQGQSMLNVAEIIAKFVDSPAKINSRINLRYDLKWISESKLEACYGFGNVSVQEFVRNAVNQDAAIFANFIKNLMIPVFARPIYIGIAQNLFQRVYEGHYQGICKYWEQGSVVNKYLQSHPNSDVQDVLDALGLSHSFALDARVRKISPRDLVVYVCPTKNLPTSEDDESDEGKMRRNIEQILQFVADPVCGRK